jgi:hypothetical protein
VYQYIHNTIEYKIIFIFQAGANSIKPKIEYSEIAYLLINTDFDFEILRYCGAQPHWSSNQ